MSKKTWSVVLKAPALLLLIASFFVGVYAAVYDMQDLGWEVPVILGVFIFLYFLGSQMEKSYYKEFNSEKPKEISKSEEPTELKEEENF